MQFVRLASRPPMQACSWRLLVSQIVEGAHRDDGLAIGGFSVVSENKNRFGRVVMDGIENPPEIESPEICGHFGKLKSQADARIEHGTLKAEVRVGAGVPRELANLKADERWVAANERRLMRLGLVRGTDVLAEKVIAQAAPPFGEPSAWCGRTWACEPGRAATSFRFSRPLPSRPAPARDCR